MISLGKFPCANVVTTSNAASAALTGLDQVVPLLGERIREELGLPGIQVGGEPHLVGVVGDDDEIERRRQSRLLSGGGRHLLALREPICVLRPRRAAGQARVERQRGVDVRVAEVGPRRVRPARVGRVVHVGDFGVDPGWTSPMPWATFFISPASMVKGAPAPNDIHRTTIAAILFIVFSPSLVLTSPCAAGPRIRVAAMGSRPAWTRAPRWRPPQPPRRARDRAADIRSGPGTRSRRRPGSPAR